MTTCTLQGLVVTSGRDISVQRLEDGRLVNQFALSELFADGDFTAFVSFSPLQVSEDGVRIVIIDGNFTAYFIHIDPNGVLVTAVPLASLERPGAVIVGDDGSAIVVTQQDYGGNIYATDGTFVATQPGLLSVGDAIVFEPTVSLLLPPLDDGHQESVVLDMRTMCTTVVPQRMPRVDVLPGQRLWTRTARFSNGDVLVLLSSINNDLLFFDTSETATLLMRLSIDELNTCAPAS